MGLRYDEVLELPWGELLDLIAVEQIKREGFDLVDPDTDGDFWALLNWR